MLISLAGIWTPDLPSVNQITYQWATVLVYYFCSILKLFLFPGWAPMASRWFPRVLSRRNCWRTTCSRTSSTLCGISWRIFPVSCSESGNPPSKSIDTEIPSTFQEILCLIRYDQHIMWHSDQHFNSETTLMWDSALCSEFHKSRSDQV